MAVRYGPDGCLTGQESAFRTDPTSERSAALGFRSGRTESSGELQFRHAPKNEREEERRIPRALYPSGDVPRSGRQNRKCGRGREIGASASPIRLCGVRERGKLARPVSGLRKIGPSRQKCRTNPEHLPNPITYFVTPAVLGGVFGPYFPMAGNPLARSRLENACTWHIRYINAYNRSAKYFSIPKPG